MRSLVLCVFLFLRLRKDWQSVTSCPLCYSNMANALANATCERCRGGFAPAEKIVNSNGELYHEQCFVCAQCFQQFPEGLFYEVSQLGQKHKGTIPLPSFFWGVPLPFKFQCQRLHWSARYRAGYLATVRSVVAYVCADRPHHLYCSFHLPISEPAVPWLKPVRPEHLAEQILS